MTEEDAIRRIEDFGLYHAIKDLPHSTRTVEAFEMAIEALKKQERNKGRLADDDLISRQALCEYALNQKDKSVTPNDIMRFPSAEPEWHDCDPTDKSTLPEPGSWAIWSDKEGHRIIARWKEDAIDHFWPDQRMFDFNLEDAVAWTEIPKRTKDTNDIDVLKELPPAQPEPRWIPCSERLPEEREWYLGIFKEPDTGWINPLPFICEYLLGKKTKAATKEGWILRGFTDREEYIDYYFNLECVAWMPLPKSYT